MTLLTGKHKTGPIKLAPLRVRWFFAVLLVLASVALPFDVHGQPAPQEASAAAALTTATAPAASAGEPSPIQLFSNIEPTTATIGQPIKLTVSITAPEMARVIVREPFKSDDPASTWTLLSRNQLPDEKLGTGETRRQIEYTLATFETGDVRLPRYEVQYQPPTGADPIVRALPPELGITIDPVLENPAQASVRDIKPPVIIPIPRWVWITAAVIVLGVALLLLWAYRAHLQRRLAALVRPPKRLDEWALDEIAALEREKLIEHHRERELYTRLADTLRAYHGKLFGVNALDLTSYELLRRLEDDTPATDETRRRTGELLDEADLVKFARHIPTPATCRRALERGREIVALTRHHLDPAPTEVGPVTGTPGGTAGPTPPLPPGGGGSPGAGGGSSRPLTPSTSVHTVPGDMPPPLPRPSTASEHTASSRRSMLETDGGRNFSR